jgi:hypothetical protein
MTAVHAGYNYCHVHFIVDIAKRHARDRFSGVPIAVVFVTLSMVATACVIAVATDLIFPEPPSFMPLIFALVGLDLYCRQATPSLLSRRAPRVCYAMIFVALSCYSGVFASYATQRLDMPLWDNMLLAADRSIGFDFRHFVHWVDARPALAALFKFSYFTMPAQIAVAAVILGFFGTVDRLRVFVRAIVHAVSFSIVFCALFPALSAITLVDTEHFDSLQFLGRAPQGHIEHLRAAGLVSFRESGIGGILCFPSFHVSSTIIATLCLRQFRPLFFLLLIVNTCLTIGTLTEGAHYAVDYLGGAVVAVGFVVVAERQTAKEKAAGLFEGID